jgi:hypothetical protein
MTAVAFGRHRPITLGLSRSAESLGPTGRQVLLFAVRLDVGFRRLLRMVHRVKVVAVR